MTTFIETLNGLAQFWLPWAVSSLWGTFFVAVIVSLVWLALRKKASAALGCWLFFLVALKLFVPLEIPLPDRLAAYMQTLPGEKRLAAVVMPAEAFRVETIRQHDLSRPLPEAVFEAKSVETESIQTIPVSTVQTPSEEGLPISKLDPVTGLALVWLLVVTGLFAKFVWNEWRFHRVCLKAPEMDMDIADLAASLEIRQKIAVRESGKISVPAVSGLFRPVILLPKCFADVLPPDELRWILLHELAHVKRHDLPMALILRVACILHFFNPAIWFAARQIRTLREFACDDLALAALKNNHAQKTGGAALLHVVEHASRNPRPNPQAIGAFNMSGKRKAALKNRMRRLLDSRRVIRPKLGLGSILVLFLVAAVCLPKLVARQDASPPTPQPPQVADAAAAENPASPSPESKYASQAIPESVTITITDENLTPMKDVLLKVQLVRDKKEFRSDEDGKVVIDTKSYQQTELGWFIFEAYSPGRVTTTWRWLRQRETPIAIPAEFTMRLLPGCDIGGVVVDEQGKPVVGAKVAPNYHYRQTGNRNADIQMARPVWEGVLTDAEGKWKAEGYSKTNGQIRIRVTHEDFLPQVDDKSASAYLMSDILAGKAKTVLKSGFRVYGTVRDEKGNPIPGIKINLDNPDMGNVPSAVRTTDEQGWYEVKSWYRKPTFYSTSTRDWTPEYGKVDFTQQKYAVGNEAQLDFTLKKGKSIRLKVVDPNGNPIKKFWVCFHSRDVMNEPFLDDLFSHDPNDEGIWEWKNAPDAEWAFDVDNIKGFARLYNIKLTPREEPYVVTAKGWTALSGKVIDAETKKPIEKFNLIRGLIRLKPKPNYDKEWWDREAPVGATGGAYSINFASQAEPENDDGGGSMNALRVEAVGYEPAQSQAIELDGLPHTLNFELAPSKTKPVRAVVLLPNGKPAVDAEVGLGGISGIAVRTVNGRIAENTGNAVVKTDVNGVFEFPTPGVPYVILAAHPDGFAFARQEEVESGTIRMIPWARIEGTAVDANGKPAAQTGLWGTFDLPDELLREVPRSQTYEAHIETITDADGKFVIDCVAPGMSGFIGFVNMPVVYTVDPRITTESGKTATVRVAKKK